MLLSEVVTSMKTDMLRVKILLQSLQFKKAYDSCVQEAITMHLKSKFLNLYIGNVL